MRYLKRSNLYRIGSVCLMFRLKEKWPRRSAAILTALLLILFLAQNAVSQQFFDVKSVIQDVQKRFRLNSADLQHISPLIQKDNADLLVIYERFGGTEPDYSPILWEKVVDQRRDFESRIGSRLTGRQASAVRVARRSLETRILGRVVEDYVDFLVVYLELEALEVEAVEHLFQKERRSKHQLVLKYLDRPEVLSGELRAVSARTDFWLGKILSPEQKRLYDSLSAPDDTMVAMLR